MENQTTNNTTVDTSYRDKWMKIVNYFNMAERVDDTERGIIKDKDNNPVIDKRSGKVKYFQKPVVVDGKVQYQDTIKIWFEHSDKQIIPQSLSVLDMETLKTHAESKDRVLQVANVVDKESGEIIKPISEYRLSFKSSTAVARQIGNDTLDIVECIFTPGAPKTHTGNPFA